jgi:hypothetical protein
MRTLPLLSLLGCSGAGTLGTVDPLPPLQLTVDTPAYAAYTGASRWVTVAGSVNRPDAVVWVEGYRANVGSAGAFLVTVPVEDLWRTIDIEASSPDGAGGVTHLRERRPVFFGDDPSATWPGGIGLRAGPSLLAALGETFEDTLDGLGWEQSILALIPSYQSDAFTIYPVSLDHKPLRVDLTPVDGGIDLVVTLPDLEIDVQIESAAIGLSLPTEIGYDSITLGATLLLSTGADGQIALGLADSTFTLGEPTLQLGGIDPVFLEDLLGSVDDFLADLGALLVDGLLGVLPAIALPSLATQLDLLGLTLETEIAAIGADPDGAWVSLGVGLDGPPGDPREIPIPPAGSADLAVALHEGLFHALLQSDLLSLLEQDLVLTQPFASALTLPLQGLPGGSALPAADSWCLTVSPGDARVARVTPGDDVIARLILADLQVTFAYADALGACTPWLTASLGAELGVVADGDTLGFDLEVVDGAVLAYAPDVPWTEDEIIAPLGATLEGLLGLLGGTLAIDLGDLLGGGTTAGTSLLGGLAPAVVGTEDLRDDAGHAVPGVIVLNVDLF